MLFDGNIKGADAESESLEMYFTESSFLHDLCHYLGLWERLHGGWQVGVGTIVATDDSSDCRHYHMGVQPE